MKISYVKKKQKKLKSLVPKIYGFMHIATINNWKDITKELISFIKGDGLLKRTMILSQVVIGPEHYLIKKNKKIKVISFGSKLNQWEYPTLKTLWEKCRASDEEFYVYYCHTKGVSYGPNIKSDTWRHAMATATLSNWKDCVKVLDSGQNTCGIMRTKNYYAGNFWWARASYIRTLKRPILTGNRYAHETWINTSDKNLEGYPRRPTSMRHYHKRYIQQKFR